MQMRDSEGAERKGQMVKNNSQWRKHEWEAAVPKTWDVMQVRFFFPPDSRIIKKKSRCLGGIFHLFSFRI
jgi:hypothetical protein